MNACSDITYCSRKKQEKQEIKRQSIEKLSEKLSVK